MPIAVKPESRPVIVGEYKGGTSPRSRAGDTLKMKCYVNSTFPSANVTWFVNGKMVSSEMPLFYVAYRNCLLGAF